MVVVLFWECSLDMAAMEVVVLEWEGLDWKWMLIGRRCGGGFTCE